MCYKFKIEESRDSELDVVVCVSSFVNFNSIIVNLFTLRIVRLNPPQVFYLETVGFISFPGSSYYCLLYFSVLRGSLDSASAFSEARFVFFFFLAVVI